MVYSLEFRDRERTLHVCRSSAPFMVPYSGSLIGASHWQETASDLYPVLQVEHTIEETDGEVTAQKVVVFVKPCVDLEALRFQSPPTTALH